MCVEIITSLIVATHPNPASKHIKPIAKNICYYSKKRHLNPYIVLALIKHESNFKVKAISRTNDYGLTQINKKYRRFKCNLFNIKCNINEGTFKLALWKKICLEKHNHSHWLRHYNWNNRRHHLRVLWMAEAYKKGTKFLLNIIKKRKYMKFKVKRLKNVVYTKWTNDIRYIKNKR